MNIKGLVVGMAVISVAFLGGCASQTNANEDTLAATAPPNTTLAPTGGVTPPILIGNADCQKCHGYIPSGSFPSGHPSLTEDGD